MWIELKNFTTEDCMRLQNYADLRPVYVSERQIVNQLIWEDYYDTHYYRNETFMMYVTGIAKGMCPMMPLCKVEDIPKVFEDIKYHWNNVLGNPLNIYLIDTAFQEVLNTIPGFAEEFKVVDDRDSYDYIYDAEKLRTLSGKAYHKKKNHLNSFLRN
jgi:hypothetical protein